MHWSMSAIVALLLCLVPAASAGTADTPEIEDDAEDGHPVAAKDLTKVWIEQTTAGEEGEEEQALWFRIETGADFEHVPALFALHERYRIAFQIDDQGPDEWYVALSPTRADRVVEGRAVPGAGDEAVKCVIGQAAADAATAIADEVAVDATFDAANQFGCIVAYSAIGIEPGANLTGLYAEHLLVTRGPISDDDKIPYTVIETFDRAPDSGHASYQTPSPPPDVNRTEESGNVTGGGNGTAAGGAGSGGNSNGGAGPAGGGGEPGDEDDDLGDADGNETVDGGDGDDKASPAAGWWVGVLALAAVALSRRG